MVCSLRLRVSTTGGPPLLIRNRNSQAERTFCEQKDSLPAIKAQSERAGGFALDSGTMEREVAVLLRKTPTAQAKAASLRLRK